MSLVNENHNTLLERGADNDIVRLRWRLKIRENIIGRLVDENERLQRSAKDWRLEAEVHRKRATAAVAEIERLRNGAVDTRETVCPHVRGTVTQHCSLNFTVTDSEREAILTAADLLIGSRPGATLRKLLERLS